MQRAVARMVLDDRRVGREVGQRVAGEDRAAGRVDEHLVDVGIVAGDGELPGEVVAVGVGERDEARAVQPAEPRGARGVGADDAGLAVGRQAEVTARGGAGGRRTERRVGARGLQIVDGRAAGVDQPAVGGDVGRQCRVIGADAAVELVEGQVRHAVGGDAAVDGLQRREVRAVEPEGVGVVAHVVQGDRRRVGGAGPGQQAVGAPDAAQPTRHRVGGDDRLGAETLGQRFTRVGGRRRDVGTIAAAGVEVRPAWCGIGNDGKRWCRAEDERRCPGQRQGGDRVAPPRPTSHVVARLALRVWPLCVQAAPIAGRWGRPEGDGRRSRRPPLRPRPRGVHRCARRAGQGATGRRRP